MSTISAKIWGDDTSTLIFVILSLHSCIRDHHWPQLIHSLRKTLRGLPILHEKFGDRSCNWFLQFFIWWHSCLWVRNTFQQKNHVVRPNCHFSDSVIINCNHPFSITQNCDYFRCFSHDILDQIERQNPPSQFPYRYQSTLTECDRSFPSFSDRLLRWSEVFFLELKLKLSRKEDESISQEKIVQEDWGCGMCRSFIFAYMMTRHRWSILNFLEVLVRYIEI